MHAMPTSLRGRPARVSLMFSSSACFAADDVGADRSTG